MIDRKPTLSHRIEHAALMSVVTLSSLAGERVSGALGGALGRLGYFPLRFRRRLVEQQLRLAFPDADQPWIERTARATYAHLGREALATLRLSRMSREAVQRRTTVLGFDEFRAVLDAGQGIVLVSGHLGNHEIGAAALSARGIPLDAVVQRQGNPLFDTALNEARRNLGLNVIDRFDAHRLAVRALRRGRVVGFAADQNAGRAGVFVPFFGRLASTHRGPALFAVKTESPLFLGTCRHRPAGYEIVLQRVEVDRTGSVDDVVYRLTAAFTARLEEVVRTAPEQYLWLHRRWKTRPPEA
ncbi:MAG TPA: lysophospholipid acyltransferase family protein [Longimicrobiales bacterium]